jgi:hypothetical protein
MPRKVEISTILSTGGIWRRKVTVIVGGCEAYPRLDQWFWHRLDLLGEYSVQLQLNSLD